jgi:transposase-like protein
MALISVVCPNCQSDEFVVKNGRSAAGKQRFLCRSHSCLGRSFGLNQSDPGRVAAVKQQIVDMTLNGSGVRDIARVLHVSTPTVIAEFKKSRWVERRQSTDIRAA